VNYAPSICRVLGDLLTIVVVQQERHPPIQQFLRPPYEGAQPIDALEFRELGSWTNEAPALAQSFAATIGRQDLVIRGGDNAYHHLRGSDHLLANRWQALGGGFSSAPSIVHRGTFVREPDADVPGYLARLRLEVVGRGLDNLVYHSARQGEDGAWSGWTAIGTLRSQFAPAIASLSESELQVFAVGLDGKLYTSAWTTERDWSAWTLVDGAPLCTSGPAVGKTGERELTLVVRGETGNVWRGVGELVRLPTRGRVRGP